MRGTGIRRCPVEGTNCKIYIEFDIDQYAELVPVVRQCPPYSYFHPIRALCSTKYLCTDTPNTLRKCEGKVLL